MNVFHQLPWFNLQIERLADGLDPDPGLSGEAAQGAFLEREARRTQAQLRAREATRSGAKAPGLA